MRHAQAGAMMTVDEELMCKFQIIKPDDKKSKYDFASGPVDA